VADGTGFVLELIGNTLELLCQVERKDYPPRYGGDFPDCAIASRDAQDGNILNELRRPRFGQLLLHLRANFKEVYPRPNRSAIFNAADSQRARLERKAPTGTTGGVASSRNAAFALAANTVSARTSSRTPGT